MIKNTWALCSAPHCLLPEVPIKEKSHYVFQKNPGACHPLAARPMQFTDILNGPSPLPRPLAVDLYDPTLSSWAYHFPIGEHTNSPVHNVILIPFTFKTFDLNINNYPSGKVQIWPMACGH